MSEASKVKPSVCIINMAVLFLGKIAETKVKVAG